MKSYDNTITMFKGYRFSSSTYSQFLSYLLLIILSLSVHAQTTSEQIVINLPTGFQNEGITLAAGDTFFTSSFEGAIFSVNSITGLVTTVVPVQENRTFVGIAATKKQLFAAGGGFLGNPIIHVFDTALGTPIATCPIQDALFLNDVTIDDNFAYYTDSSRAQIYKLSRASPGACEIERIMLPSQFDVPPGSFAANGIVRFANGLIITHSLEGRLYFVELDNERRVYPLNAVNSTLSPDGLDIRIGTDSNLLVVAQNAFSAIAQFDVVLTESGLVEISLKKRMMLTDQLANPSTVAFFENRNALALALPRFRSVTFGATANETFSVGILPL